MGTHSRGEFLFELAGNVPISVIVTHFQRMKVSGSGKTLTGLSPFTKERTSSFVVLDKRGFYHDFSSGKSGNSLSFLIEACNMSGQEAVTFILELTEYKFVPRKFQRQRTKRRRTRSRGT